MKRALLPLLLLALPATWAAQTVTPTVLSNNGGYSSSAQGSIEWTIGEPVSETYTKPNNITTMGFHQPQLEMFTILQEHGKDGGLVIFPNPVIDLLKINFAGMPEGSYSVKMHDAIGKLILETATVVSENSNVLEIKVNEVAAGSYFITVSKGDYSQSVKISKVY